MLLSLLRVCAAFPLALIEIVKPVEMPCLRCKKHMAVRTKSTEAIKRVQVDNNMRGDGLVPILLGRHLQRHFQANGTVSADLFLQADGTYQQLEWGSFANSGAADLGSWWVSGQKLNLDKAACFQLLSLPAQCAVDNVTMTCDNVDLADLRDIASIARCSPPSSSGLLLAVDAGVLYLGDVYTLG